MGKIVWLASYPKSGNTWVRVFLHNYIARPDEPYSINNLHDLSATENNAAFFNKYEPRRAGTFTTQDTQKLRALVHRDLTLLHDDLVFVKTHNANLAVHGIPLCTPVFTAGAIYIIRDPRDVAVSYAAYTGQSIDQIIAFMARPGAANRGDDVQVFEFYGPWSAHADSWAQQKPQLAMRYEDLVGNPEQNFGKIIHFLGGEPEPERLARAIEFSRFATLAAQEAAHGYNAGGPNMASTFFRAGQAGNWRNVLTPAQQAQIESDHAAVMQRFGYL
jgi:hypothetical protein